MSKNVDIVAVVALLLAAALFGGVRDAVMLGLHGSSKLVRIERDGSRIFVRPLVPMPPIPPLPPFPRVQHD